ncbi:MAG: alpha/beta fold hydrolase [Pseudomonadota bacterium]
MDMIVARFSSTLLRSLFVLIVVPLASACATKAPPLALIDPGAAAGKSHDVIVATSREPVDDPIQAYSDGRSTTLSFNLASIWAPEERVLGSITFPSDPPNPEREFAITSFEDLEPNRVQEVVNARLNALSQEKIIFLFVHGYNVPYSSAVYRIGQMVNDFEIDAVPILYSWPSAGRPLGYMYDRDSVQFARDGFVELLTELSETDAESIFLIGHSMGTLLVMESLRQLSLTGQDGVIEKIAPLVLASPDIDVDVFRTQIEALSLRPDPIVIFVANDDGALRLSKQLRGGHPRVGDGGDIPALQQAGIAVVDLTEVELGEGTQHSAFASSPELIGLLRQAAAARATLTDASRPIASATEPLEVLGSFTEGLIFLPKRLVN